MSDDYEDILKDSLEFLGGKPVIDEEVIKYGPLALTVAPKHGKANTLLADHLFSPSIFLAERIERGLFSQCEGKTVLELGAGAALPSLLLATVPNPPKLVVVTDHPDEVIFSNLRNNVTRNQNVVDPKCVLACHGFEWGANVTPLLIRMVEDRYIGLILAISSSVAIGTSYIVAKKGLNDAANKSAGGQKVSHDLSYLNSPTWWAGMVTLVIGEALNFAAYTFAPPILVTPLGALSVIIGAILASIFLKEQLGHLGRVGCTLCLLGSLIIVLHAPSDVEINSVEEFLSFATRPAFTIYCVAVFVVSVAMIYYYSPKYGRTNPVVYISICSLVGSASVMAIKGFGIAVKLTLGGNNQFRSPTVYILGLATAGSAIVQMHYLNKALATFSTNVVSPLYYVGFSTATIVASIILFRGFNTDDPSKAVSLVTGFIVTCLGVNVLNLSRNSTPPVDHPSQYALEDRPIRSRLSIQDQDPLLDDFERGASGDSVGLRTYNGDGDDASRGQYQS
ncbi:hypothetical protein EST38_g8418 [Candolleomyces aberdarensis]|uniref:DUF803-domain-containing protein n=1 Tax=Candolleomyces aberdarensis TaxID=2316362 RepID=A0A4Q2DG14_9AGAR|nr:hypothetical protein EST38_g8418 [Candolleomyces aberdarensis]